MGGSIGREINLILVLATKAWIRVRENHSEQKLSLRDIIHTFKELFSATHVARGLALSVKHFRGVFTGGLMFPFVICNGKETNGLE
jgi:hypothetical protein